MNVVFLMRKKLSIVRSLVTRNQKLLFHIFRKKESNTSAQFIPQITTTI